MLKTGIILKNKYRVKSMPKTTAKVFKDLKDGDIIEISLELTYSRSGGNNNSLYAYYPKINGIVCSGIPIIQKLIERGMVLEETC